MPHKNQGFTLIEVAMVLTIIGLIIGGVLTAKTLIRAAQVQSVVSDVDRYKKAVQLFKEKYLYLPGDLPTATNFWGADTSCNATPANIAPKTATCNGNGDGVIGDSGEYVDGEHVTANTLEAFRMWQHLANAGFIDGSYTGAFSSRANQEDPGMNTPLSKVPGGSFLLFYAMPMITVVSWFPANYRHVIVYGAPSSKTANGVGPIPPANPILTAMEAFSIDQKVDDGFPGTGNVLTYTPSWSATPNCLTPWSIYTYNISYGTSTNYCSLIFITGF